MALLPLPAGTPVSDDASHVLCSPFCRMFLPHAGRVSIVFVAMHDGTFEAMERGRLDLELNADDGHTADRFHRKVIYQDDLVFVVAKDSRHARRLTLKQYLAGVHVGVGVLAGRQAVPEHACRARPQAHVRRGARMAAIHGAGRWRNVFARVRTSRTGR